MKLAISNIAWRSDEDVFIADHLPRWGAQGIELAPTRLWPQPLSATAAQVTEQRRFWESRGLPVVALQSLLFGHPELTLFDSAETRAKTLAYLTGMIHLARDLGAKVLVFGSPKNRLAGHRSAAEVQAMAVDFFRELGNRAAGAGVSFCIEPNPSYYACDFVTTSQEGRALVDSVKSAGFGLHLDAAAMTLAQESLDAAITASEGQICHFHASEKDLAPLGGGSVEHAQAGAALRRIGYAQWVSAEMRAAPEPISNRPAVQKALELLQTLYVG